jgi:hypothetical protein
MEMIVVYFFYQRKINYLGLYNSLISPNKFGVKLVFSHNCVYCNTSPSEMSLQMNTPGPNALTGSGQYATQWKSVMSWFGTPGNLSPTEDISTRPCTNDTILHYYGNKLEYAGQMLQTQLVDLKGWHFEVAELKKEKGLAKIIDKLTLHNAVMKPAPTESVPEFLTYSTEKFVFRLTKYHGAFETNAEFLMTAPGQELFAQQQAQAVGSMNTTLKLLLTTAIINAPNEWIVHARNTQYASVRDALSREVNMTFVVNKDPEALFSTNNWVKAFTSEYNTKFDAIVMPFNSLNSIVYSGHETDPQKIKEDVSYDRLVRGKDSLQVALPGMTIYEDPILNVQNLPANIEMLKRRMFQGEFVIVGDTSYGSRDHSGRYHSEQDSSISTLDATNDTLSPIFLSECIENDMAWEGNEPSPKFSDMINNIQGVLTKTGIEIFRDQYDPWIITSKHVINDGNRPVGNGAHVISTWGNQALAYRSLEQDTQYGSKAADKIKAKLGAEKLKILDDGKQLTKRLYDINDIKAESVQGFFFAVGANQENWMTPDAPENMYKSTGSIYLKGNPHGSVNIPYVDQNPEITNMYNEMRGDSEFLVRDQAIDLKGSGVMYVMINGLRYYVWALEYEDNPLVELDARKFRDFGPNVVDNENDFGDVAVGGWVAKNSSETGRPIYVFGDWARKNNIDDPGRRAISASLGTTRFVNKLKGFILAPFDFFGRVSTDGRAKNWMRNLNQAIRTDQGDAVPTSQAQFLSNEGIFVWATHHLVETGAIDDYTWARIGAAADRVSDQMGHIMENFGVKRGIKAPRLVRAPLIPWGNGYIHSLRTLADMYINDTRGWPTEICKRAFEYVQVYDEYAEHNVEISPECIVLNSIYSPEFMHTGNVEEDIKNNIHFNFVESATHPIWVRTPTNERVEQKPLSAESDPIYLPSLMLYDSPTQDTGDDFTRWRTTTSWASQFSESEIARILEHMGILGTTLHYTPNTRDVAARALFDATAAGLPGNNDDIVFGTDPRATIAATATINLGILARKLMVLLSSRSIDSNLKAILKDNMGTNGQTASLFSNYASERSGLGSSYADLKRRESNTVQYVNSSFITFLYHKLSPLLDDPRLDGGQQQNAQNLQKAVSLFNGILNLANASMRSEDGFRNQITAPLLSSLENYVSRNLSAPTFEDVGILNASRTQRNTNVTRYALPVTQVEGRDESARSSVGWINSRLFLTQKVWDSLFKLLTSPSATEETLSEYYLIPIRPTNPVNPVEPLASDLVIGFGRDGTRIVRRDELQSQFQQFKAARADMKTTFAIQNTVLGNAHMYAKARQPRVSSFSSGVTSRTQTHRTRMAQRGDAFAAISTKPNIVFPAISDDPTGAFFTMSEWTDREGRPLPDQTRFVKEENLQDRLLHAYNAIPDMVARVASLMMLLTKVTRSSELNWLKQGLPIPDAVYFCPRIACMITSAAFWIEKKNCAELGYNFIQTTISLNNTRENLVLKYAGYFGAHVIQPKKLYIFPNWKASGIVCGLDNTFYNHPDQFDPRNLAKQKASFFAFRCGSQWGLAEAQANNPISLFGRYDPEMYIQNIPDTQRKIFLNRQQWPSFLFYDYILGLTDMKPNPILNNKSFADFKNNPGFYGLVWLRKYMRWNNNTGKYDKVEHGTSFLGDFDPPMRDKLNGGSGLFQITYK